MAIVATGFVRVRVLSNTLGDEIKRAVERSLGGMDADMKRHGRRMGRNLGDGMREGIKDGGRLVENEGEQIGRRTGTRVVQGTRTTIDRNLAPSLVGAFRGGTRRATPGILGAFQGLTTRVGGRVARMFGGRFVTRAFGGLSGALEGVLGGIKAFAKPEITSWFWSIGTALTTSIVPALAWIGGNAARGVGILAAGFSSLVISGGLFALALAQDSEEMDRFVEKWKELGKIIGTPIQQEFLSRTEDGMERLKKLAQDLESEFREVGAAWGDAFDQFTVMLGTEKSLGNIQRILKTSAKTTRDFGTATTNVVDGFLTLLAHAEPLVNYVSEGAVKMGEWFNNTLSAKAASGELDKSMQKMLDKWKKTWETVKDFGAGIQNIFRAASPITEKFGDAMGRIGDKFREWTSDPTNQERITAFFEKSSVIAGRFMDILGNLAVMAGTAFENLDETKILQVLDIFENKLLPAIQGFYNQFKGQNAEKWVQFFDNMAGALQKIVDSGVIETVGSFVADIAVSFSELLNSDAAGWFVGLYLALMPLGGLLSSVGSALMGLYYAIRLMGLVGGGAAAAGGAAGGAAAGGGIMAGVSGMLLRAAAGVGAALLIIEVLRTQSDTLDQKMDQVYSSLGTVVGRTKDLATIGLATGFNTWLSLLNGDIDSAVAGVLEATEKLPWLTEAVYGIVVWGNNFNKLAGEGVVRADWTSLDMGFGNFISNLKSDIDGLGTALGAGRDAVIASMTGFWTALQQMPLVLPDGTLSPFNDLKVAIGKGFSELLGEIASGGPNVSAKIADLRSKINQLPAGDPVLGPLRDQMQQQLDNLVREQDLAKAPNKLRGMVESLNSIDFALNEGGLFSLRDNIVGQLEDLAFSIETRSPLVPQQIENMVALLNQIPSDAPPALQDLKNNVTSTLSELGYNITLAGDDVNTSVAETRARLAEGFKSLSDITLPEPDWKNFRWDMKPLYNDIQEQAASLGEAIAAGSSDIPAKIASLVAMLNTVPADAPPQLLQLKQQILDQLTGLGTDMGALAPGLAQKAQGIGTNLGAGFANLDADSQGRIATAQAALVAALGTDLPSAIQSTGPALGSATLLATANVGTAATEQFSKANTDAAEMASRMSGIVAPALAGVSGTVSGALASVSPAGATRFSDLNTAAGAAAAGLAGAILPGLFGAAAAVPSTLAPVASTGASPFSSLGTSLGSIVGGFAGKIIPGLSSAAKEPGSKFSPIEQSGVTPWLSMSASIISAMNTMNASVARVLAAVAAVVVSAWAVIGRANAAGLAGTLTVVTATVAAARVAERATQTVVEQVLQIARLMIQIREAVTAAREAKDKVREYAADAAGALVSAASAASQAANAASAAAANAANAAVSRAAAGGPVLAAEGGIFNPVSGGTLTLIAEAGRRERVEPLDSQGLSRRDRAMISHIVGQLAGGGGGSGGDTRVEISLDGRALSGVVSSVVTSQLDSQARNIQRRRRVTA